MQLGFCIALCLSVHSQQERLPEVEFKESEPQAYRFVCEYQQTDADDHFVGKQRIQATYVRGLPAGRVEWSDVSIASAGELEADFPTPGKALDYMSGFGYDGRHSYKMFLPDFFTGFPGTTAATYAKNLVWDTHMLEQFARSYFAQLRLNEPYVAPKVSDSSVPLAGMGAFKNGSPHT